jgi:hypothetical protein
MGCCWNLLAGSPACLPQIYFNQLLSRYTRYKLTLAGFEKVHIRQRMATRSRRSAFLASTSMHTVHISFRFLPSF